jgi:methylamine dehydrogenase accessory protein MauD
MHGVMMASYIALWLVVILLSVGLAALAGQIGILHRRLEPAGARVMNAGPSIGESIAVSTQKDIYGRYITFPITSEGATLITFVSPGCAMCDEVMPAVKALAQQEKHHIRVILASFAGDEASNRAYAAQHHLSGLPYLFSFQLAHQFSITNAPYALLIDDRGVLRTKGLVNNREHLDSLLNVLDGPFQNVQTYWASRERQLETSGEKVGSEHNGNKRSVRFNYGTRIEA